MSLILNIDCAADKAFVSLALNASVIASADNPIQKDHAAFLHPAIKTILEESGKKFDALDAIAVNAGPGSYTGIRVGMATAKGLCMALNKPLIIINSLEILTRDAIINHDGDETHLYCPMIDARRMEVYTAIYNKAGIEVLAPTALVLDENFYRKYTTLHKLILFGSGAEKCRKLSIFQEALFIQNVNLPQAMANLSQEAFRRKTYADLIFSEPIYLKEFFKQY